MGKLKGAYLSLLLSELQVFLSAHLVLLQEGAELDKVVLDEDVLLSEFSLSHLKALFFPASNQQKKPTSGTLLFGLRRLFGPHT